MGRVSIAEEQEPYRFRHARLRLDGSGALLRYRQYSAISRFQPILSLAHRRPVGFEALVGVHDPRDRPCSPADFFALGAGTQDLVELDRACRELHLHNFARQETRGAWLFLNVNPTVAVEGRRFGPFFAEALARNGVPAPRIVIEFTESRLADERMLETAVRYYRDLGCLVAIDDFGAGESNFSRIWRLKPDIVKLDRATIVAATADAATRRMVSGLVGLLHEAGALVCVEGIETEREAHIAVEASADLLQGYLFAMPDPTLARDPDFLPLFERLGEDFARDAGAEAERSRRALSAYLGAFDAAARDLESGRAPEQATAAFLQLAAAERCFVLDERGRQVGQNLLSCANRAARDPRFEPLYDVQGANWSARHYFRRAVQEPGRIQKTRPYLSLNGPRMCITFSVMLPTAAGRLVLCADLDASRLDETSPAPPRR